MLVTSTRITQAFLVTVFPSGFDRLRWYRSTAGRNGFFEPATWLTAMPATLRGLTQTRALNGLELKLRLAGGVVLDVPFTQSDPIELADVVSILNAASVLLDASSTPDGQLVISTALTGSFASIEVIDSTAVPFLGLLPGEAAVGLDADGVLDAGQAEYRLNDSQSSPLFLYRTAMIDSSTGQSLPPSAPFPSRTVEAISLDLLLGCFVRLADLTGRPLGGRRVIVHNVFVPNRVMDLATAKTWGIFRNYEELVTDPNGFASIFLLRGATVDITISGTGFTRRVVVPLTGSTIDLLSPSLSDTDEFGIQKPTIDFAIRTS
jgi:hypothetical protein